MGSVTLHPDSQPEFPNLFAQSFTQNPVEGTVWREPPISYRPTGALNALIHSNSLSRGSSKAENCFALHALFIRLPLPRYRFTVQKASAQ